MITANMEKPFKKEETTIDDIVNAYADFALKMQMMLDNLKLNKTPCYTFGDLMKAINKYQEIYNQYVHFDNVTDKIDLDGIVNLCYQIFTYGKDNETVSYVKKDVKEEYSIDNFLWEMTFPGYSIKHLFVMPTNFDAKSKTLSMGEIVALCYVIFDKPNSDRVSEILFSEKGIKHTYVDGREHFKPYDNCKLPIYTKDEFVKEAMRFTDKNIIYVDGENTLSMKYIVGLCYKLFRKDVE